MAWAGDDQGDINAGGDSELEMGSIMRESAMEKWWEEAKMREAFGNYGADLEEAIVVAQEAEEQEQELQQIEDMLDYYLSRAAMAEDEAQQMLSGARDLEESIGVSLSARRLELIRPIRIEVAVIAPFILNGSGGIWADVDRSRGMVALASEATFHF